ncbi:hypothetical protein [Microbacterium imperiale]|uniref:DUF559 domain-containing protein n=1 Tax=Microbacterium imperiale TaxID=33884 RepID=A0A9W6HI26_9MICO|nr:hypothetical protein [Microbacterium imperiale]MBP2421693.1 hypothetical protein [Microbacterium imperiale]MDS0199205.1 hypothetical protein [Microbacterium imperiale]BFE42036.1 hypothetical protein GCM10017544_29920 [Microbacterium imperiale]GLJ80989.1 hypothetical protein GCM10017586_26720 [Microbacterium imperiale]
MPRTPAPLPDDLGEVFGVAQARAAGVTRGRLGARDLEAPFHGVRARLAPARDTGDGPLARDRAQRERVLRRAQAYARVAPEGAFFAGRTAAVLHGCPVVHPADSLEVGVVAPGRAPRARGIHGIKVADHLVTIGELHGVRVVSAASAWAMLGRTASVRELIIAGDALVAIPRGPGGGRMPHRRLCTPAQLRAALPHIREGAMSPPETELRLDLVTAGLPEPMLDVEIRDDGGRLLGITELVYPDARVAIEVEGDHHRTSKRQWDRDLEKYATYTAAGWLVVRVTVSQVRSHRAVTLVRRALAAAR